MDLEDLKKCKVALTHSGQFHSDDVFGAAFLKIINPNMEIRRVSEVPNSFLGIVFDIGGGSFDHHSYDNELRENGIPYAAFGKLWKAYAPELYGEYVYEKIDKSLIQDLDLSDNTGKKNSLALAISSFNPINRNKCGDEEFAEAVEFAKRILENLINKELEHERDLKIVKEYYEKADNKQILVMDEYHYFKDYLPSTNAIYVIFPSVRGGYVAEAITKSSDTIESKVPFPKKWLVNLPSYLTFCHSSRFLIAGKEKEDLIKACIIALKISEV